jgi:tRNA pseudouridine65 synthase
LANKDSSGAVVLGAVVLEILYQDEDMVVINKPAGLLVHRSPIDKRETRFAVQLLRDQLGVRVHPIHRLDKPTSGALVFGLCPEIAKSLAQAFADHEVTKTYLAVVRGFPEQAGQVDYPLGIVKDKYDPTTMTRQLERQDAVTDYQLLAKAELPVEVDRYPTTRYSLVALRPRTGRQHQLRRHMAHLTHPLVGDVTYGVGKHNRFFRERFDCHRLLLAAVEVALKHPRTGEQLVIKADVGPEFLNVISQLGWDEAIANPWR